MIHVVIPSKRKKPTSWIDKYTPTRGRHISAYDMQTLSTEQFVGEYFTEILKRNAILQAVLKDCQFKVGDIVVPSDPDELKLHGEECEITGIFSNLTKYEPVWPKDNKPYTMKFISKKTGKSFYCNPAFFKEKNEVIGSGV